MSISHGWEEGEDVAVILAGGFSVDRVIVVPNDRVWGVLDFKHGRTTLRFVRLLPAERGAGWGRIERRQQGLVQATRSAIGVMRLQMMAERGRQ